VTFPRLPGWTWFRKIKGNQRLWKGKERVGGEERQGDEERERERSEGKGERR